MRPPVIILCTSLVVNAVLIAGLVSRVADFRESSAASAGKEAGGDLSPPVPGDTNTGAAEALSLRDDLRLADVWQSLCYGQPKDLIDRLRAAGFPPHVLRMIAEQIVREQLVDRQRARYAGLPAQEYWKASFNRYGYDVQFREAQRELLQERRTRLRDLLGADYEPPDMTRETLANLGRRYGLTDPERLGQLHQLERDYGELRVQLASGEGTGIRLPQDNEALKLLNAEMRSDLEAMLTPEELEEYDRRNSSTASSMRRRLTDLDLSEDEYHALYDLQKSFDDRYAANYTSGSVLPGTPEFAQEREVARKELNAAISALLGPERAGEYERGGDYFYDKVKRVVGHLGLPRETAVAVHESMRDAQQRVSRIHGDRTLSAEEQATQLSALRDEVAGRISTALTPEGLEIFRLNGGQFFDQLFSPPRLPPR